MSLASSGRTLAPSRSSHVSEKIFTSNINAIRPRRHLLQQIKVKAAQDPDSLADINSAVGQLKDRASALFTKYDFVSAGLGALAVTTVCVARGQDPGTALWITAASTVVALVINDSIE